MDIRLVGSMNEALTWTMVIRGMNCFHDSAEIDML